MNQKNKMIKDYIANIANQVNGQYNGLIDDDKISRAIKMFSNSNEDFETEIIPKINKMVQEVIDNYLEFKRQIEEMIKSREVEQFDELAILDLNTDKNGVFLSQQQIDLLMITELQSKEQIKEYIETMCGQFTYKNVEDIIENYESIITPEQLEQAKRTLFEKYQESIIDYISNSQMSDVEKAKVKLEKLGINGQELETCLQQVSQGKINETFIYLGQKYGNDFITKLNRTMNDDFDNVKSVSYEEMKSLSDLISRDKSIDTIIMATGTFNNSVYPSLNGNAFDPFLTKKALQYCANHDIHMRYHTLFDQSRVEQLLNQGKGLKDHDQILAEMKSFVQVSMQYIEKYNRQLSDGSMLINEVEIFNELVERNKDNKNAPYEMIWEKHFGITPKELASCFDGIKKPNGVEYMYNETTLTESPFKRQKVEETLDKIVNAKPNLIDRFGDQMHLSDEDIITKQGRDNLQETAQMIKRIQDKKIYVGGKEKYIKTECTEHDFHFTKPFLKNVNTMQQNGQKVDLWQVKRKMQDYISKTYTSNGVNFERSTYWSLFGKNDHNLVRANKSIVKENKKRKEEGKKENPLINTMSAGLIPDGKKFSNIKSLKSNKKQQKQLTQQEKLKPFAKRSQSEIQVHQQIKQKNQIIKQQKAQKKQMNKPKVKTLTQSSSNSSSTGNKGFTNVVTLSLIVSFVCGALFMIVYMLIKGL
ncbi:unknown [Clostridium sp. CAG:417]|nr:unknown [Clostridium sp. CAG:417]